MFLSSAHGRASNIYTMLHVLVQFGELEPPLPSFPRSKWMCWHRARTCHSDELQSLNFEKCSSIFRAHIWLESFVVHVSINLSGPFLTLLGLDVLQYAAT